MISSSLRMELAPNCIQPPRLRHQRKHDDVTTARARTHTHLKLPSAHTTRAFGRELASIAAPTSISSRCTTTRRKAMYRSQTTRSVTHILAHSHSPTAVHPRTRMIIHKNQFPITVATGFPYALEIAVPTPQVTSHPGTRSQHHTTPDDMLDPLGLIVGTAHHRHERVAPPHKSIRKAQGRIGKSTHDGSAVRHSQPTRALSRNAPCSIKVLAQVPSNAADRHNVNFNKITATARARASVWLEDHEIDELHAVPDTQVPRTHTRTHACGKQHNKPPGTTVAMPANSRSFDRAVRPQHFVLGPARRPHALKYTWTRAYCNGTCDNGRFPPRRSPTSSTPIRSTRGNT